MTRILALISLVAAAPSVSWSQVQVLNSASLQPGLPTGGALATIFFAIPQGFPLSSYGSFSAPATGPLPFRLGDIEVIVNNAMAPLLAVDIPFPGQSTYGRIDFQVPMARNGTIPLGESGTPWYLDHRSLNNYTF